MPSTFFGLTIGSSGLNAANVALNTTAHNIANTQTKGYSRQQTQQSASEALRVYATYGMQGSGVTVHNIVQVRDSYYDYKYWNNNGVMGEYESKTYYTGQIEDVFYDEMTEAGFTVYYNNFCNALDALYSDSSEVSKRNQAIQSGQTLAEYYNNIAENLEMYQEEANTQIKVTLDRINAIAENVASLNNQISVMELNGGYANDLRDERNMLVDELSKLVGIEVKEVTTATGSISYNIRINNQSLVYGNKYNTLKVTSKDSDEKRHETDVTGLYEISWDTDLSFNVYHEELSGVLRGYIDIRDGDNLETPIYPVDEDGNPIGKAVDYKGIPYYMKETNSFLAEYTRRFNEIHMSGEDLNDNSTEFVPFFSIKSSSGRGMNGEDIKEAIVLEKQQEAIEADPDKTFTEAETEAMKNAVTTEDMITYISENITAGNICVNPDLVRDNSLMATASRIDDGIETPDLIRQLNNLRQEKLYKGGTPEEVMQSLVSVSSVDALAAKSMYNSHSSIGEAITNQRLSVMGVDSDEEAMSLSKFQHAYELASKVITVMNEILNKLINETGV